MSDEPPAPPTPTPYGLDITVTLASGGTLRLIGRGLDMAGMRDMLDLVRQAMSDG